MTPGSGTGTPIAITSAGSGQYQGSVVTLAQYAAAIGYMECAFFGIKHPDNDHWECREIWSLSQRTMIAHALAEAQALLEEELRYPLSPRWIASERHVYAPVLLTTWGHLLAAGVLSDTVIAAAAAVNHAADPATVTVNGVTCAVGDIHVYHTGTDDEIEPSALTLAGGVLTISLPWCRLVAPAYAANPADGWDYAQHATWIAATVDVHCLTTDDTTQAVHIRGAHHCTCDSDCTETETAACIHIRQALIGSVDTRNTATTGCHHRPHWVELNYLAGLESVDRMTQDVIIRLAHSLMPDEPCGCDVTQRLWRRDREIPTVLDRERLNCPFGLSAGAWFAWKWAQGKKLVRGAVL